MRPEDQMYKNYKSDPLQQFGTGVLSFTTSKGQLAEGYQCVVGHPQDVNGSTETVYPRGKNNSMNKKLEAAKNYLKGIK